jgi:peptidoglycan/xylan/chitin deacetylase (PgdA/CDA1 family)
MAMNRVRAGWKRIPVGIRIVLILLPLVFAYRFWIRAETAPHVAMLGIVAPDGMTASDPGLAVWLDAAREQGIQAETVHLSALLGASIWADKVGAYRALVLPDQLLRQSDRKLARVLQKFAEQGGQLLICYDALSRAAGGDRIEGRAQLSEMAGIDYALFDTLGTGAIIHGPVLGTEESMAQLQIPPGKPVPWPSGKAGQLALTTYQYGFMTYPHFVTRGAYSGRVLLEGADGSLVLGEKKQGRGGVMFANLPLGDLSGRADGLLLHGVLHRLSDLAALPTLAATPGGVGGLVFNWHIDANTSMWALTEFERRGLFAQGPFSIHFTAGPDAHKPGDRAGMDLERNPAMHQWIKKFNQRGDALGNHGCLVHDYFGTEVDRGKSDEMKTLLTRNDDVLSNVAGHPIREYSAPLGTQPEWVTEWIEKRGVLGYYFTGNAGMTPTRSYRQGKLRAHRIWSFPILSLNQIASFEEASEDGVPSDYMTQWLISIAEFSADSGTVRTFYSHPPGWRLYFDAIQAWFKRTAELRDEGRFRWYTMERIAQFLNRREQVRWLVSSEAGFERFTVSHPQSVAEMSWRLPKDRYGRPVLESGLATISDAGKAWMVVAASGTSLVFNAPTQGRKQ